MLDNGTFVEFLHNTKSGFEMLHYTLKSLKKVIVTVILSPVQIYKFDKIQIPLLEKVVMIYKLYRREEKTKEWMMLT